jgi:hypothetical protein
VAELVARVREALHGSLPAAAAKMRLYLPSTSTHSILFKPIKSNVAEAHGQASGRSCKQPLRLWLGCGGAGSWGGLRAAGAALAYP